MVPSSCPLTSLCMPWHESCIYTNKHKNLTVDLIIDVGDHPLKIDYLKPDVVALLPQHFGPK